MERSAGGVQADCGPVVVDVEVEPDIGIPRVDGGALTLPGAEIVDDGVLQAQGGELGMADMAVGDGGENSEGTRRRQKILPGNLLGLLVKVSVGMAVEGQKRGEDAGRQP